MENNTTEMQKSEQETKALDQVINILTIFIIALVAFSAGYYYAAVRLTAMLNN